MLRMQQRAANAYYLAVLYPRATGATEPALGTAEIFGGHGIIADLVDARDVVWQRDTDVAEAIVTGLAHPLYSDAALGYARAADAASPLQRFSLQDATQLRNDDQTIFSTTELVDVSIELDDGQFAGFVRGPSTGYSLVVSLSGRTFDGAAFTGELLGTAVTGDLLTLDLAGEGDLTLRFSASASVITLVSVGAGRPKRYALHPNRPNPFNPATQIRFDLPIAGPVRLTIYNALGQEVERLVERDMAPGLHAVEWDAAGYRSGIYFCELIADSYRARDKMLLLH